MKANKQLSIVIPTFNRADFLDYSLEVHIPLSRIHNIQICIFDNASTDNTEDIATKWMRKYSYLSYHKNETNIGPDANFERSLKYPDTDYVWLLGDTYQLPKNGISYLLKIIKNKKYDAIVFNLVNQLKLPTKNYADSNLLLYDLGALMACLSCLVFNKELLNRANFSRYYNSFFTQTGIIFGDISNKDFLIHWVQTESVNGLKHPSLRKTNWSHTPKAFETGCEDWTNFVMSLPFSYKIQNKMKCIMDFGTGLFTLQNLVFFRIRGLLNLKIFNKYKKLFVFTINLPTFLILTIAITPIIILKLFGIFAVLVFKKDKLNKIKTIFKG